jgi:hypothetical protein
MNVTELPELSADELSAHASAIASASDEEQFVEAFAEYVRDVVERERDPYEKVAGFVFHMMAGMREVVEAIATSRGGGTA